MALFDLFKKKEEKETPACCCSAEPKKEEPSCCCSVPKGETASCCCGKPVEGICCIKVLGAGCKSCHQQYEYAKEAAENLGLECRVEYVTDMEKIMAYGVMSMPAIVINDKIASAGRVLKTKDVEKLLKDGCK